MRRLLAGCSASFFYKVLRPSGIPLKGQRQLPLRPGIVYLNSFLLSYQRPRFYGVKRKIWSDIERRIIPVKTTETGIEHNVGA